MKWIHPVRLASAVKVGAAAGALALSGCAHVSVDPIQVQTIHIQHDVTIGVDKALEDFFAFQEQQGNAATRASASTNATTNTATTAPAAPTAEVGSPPVAQPPTVQPPVAGDVR